MRARWSALALVVVIGGLAAAPPLGRATAAETPAQKEARLRWWTDARFGMFIHWGLYSLPARHEWVKKNERHDRRRLPEVLRPVRPGPLRPAGLGADGAPGGHEVRRHHLQAPRGLLPVRLEAHRLQGDAHARAAATCSRNGSTAFRAEGLRVGFYHSLIDWHHPSYTIDRNHPQSATTDEEYAQLNQGRDMAVYRQYLKDQVRELLTELRHDRHHLARLLLPGRDARQGPRRLGLGEPAEDGPRAPARHHRQRPAGPARRRGRLGLPTPEQFKPREWVTMNGVRVPWEACQTFSGSWGYHRDEMTWKSPEQLVELLVDTVSKGGNLLLNVGPTARGTFDQRAQDRLAAIGGGCRSTADRSTAARRRPAEFKAPPNTLLTYNPQTRRLYVHVLAWPMGDVDRSRVRRQGAVRATAARRVGGADEHETIDDMADRAGAGQRARAEAAHPPARRGDSGDRIGAQVRLVVVSGQWSVGSGSWASGQWIVVRRWPGSAAGQQMTQAP